MISKGDKSSADLAATWRQLYETLKDWRAEREKREWEAEQESEQETEAKGEEHESHVV